MAKQATKAERDYMSRVAGLGCIVCGAFYGVESEAEIHHIGNGTMGTRASNYEVIPLCHAHHRTGGYGVAVHAGRKAFEKNYTTEQELLEMTREALNG